MQCVDVCGCGLQCVDVDVLCVCVCVCISQSLYMYLYDSVHNRSTLKLRDLNLHDFEYPQTLRCRIPTGKKLV